jgi:GntR family transcriptional regulator/MocR family aminotransferase
LYRQLYNSLRRAILSHQLLPGMRLPASRALAHELGVSRNTVLEAFDQLRAEGYLETRVGAGTFVTHDLPDRLLRVRGAAHQASPPSPAHDGSADALLSERGQLLTGLELSAFQDHERPRAFRPGIPALDAFPIETWSRLTARRWRSVPASMLSYSDSAGYPPLRKAIAEYLQASRGVRCTPDQVIVVSGTQQAIMLTAHVLLSADDVVWFEEPGYPRARGAFRWAGAQIVPVPLDEEGLDIETGTALDGTARLAYVTPSHQYPMGMTMSLRRRLELVDWAEQSDAWILEDDYDSEYRYEGRPIAALQGLDEGGRTIYVGTFSKVLFPALRLGYIVVPNGLVDAFVAARALVDRCPPLIQQMVVADFISEGYFEQHLRRMRTLYAARQSALLKAVERQLGEYLRIGSDKAGLHLTGVLPPDVDDRAVSHVLEQADIVAPPLSFYSTRDQGPGGLVLGYAAVDEGTIRDGVPRIAEAITAVRDSGATPAPPEASAP